MYQGVEQQAQRAEAVADRPQQPLGQGDLAGMAGGAAQAGHDRHRARSVAAGDDGAERHEGLAQQEGRTVSLVPVVEPHGDPGRLGRTARRQGVIDDGEASRPAGLAPDDATQRRHQSQQPEAPVFDHPVVGLPAEPRRQRQDRPGDVPAAAQQGSEDQLGDGTPGGTRDGSHDLPHPSGQRRRDAGLALRYHGALGCVVGQPQHGAAPPATPPPPRQASPGQPGLETPVKLDRTRGFLLYHRRSGQRAVQDGPSRLDRSAE